MKKGLLVMDIDDTIVKTKSFIIKRKNGKEYKLTSEEFANDKDRLNKEVEFDFCEFRDKTKIKQSILRGTPIIKNLQIIDKYAQMDYDLAFLTARCEEDIIYNTLLRFLKIRNKDGRLEPILTRLSKELSVAVDDDKYEGLFHASSNSEKKAEVLNDYCEIYDSVIFIDDDPANLRAARKLKRPNLKIIQALNEKLI
jgi:hypothetical protein